MLFMRLSKNVNVLFRGCSSLAEGALSLPSLGEAGRGREIYFGFKRGMCVSDRCPCQKGAAFSFVFLTVHADARSLGRSWVKAGLWQDVITSAGTINSFSSTEAKLRLLTLTGDACGWLMTCTPSPVLRLAPVLPRLR